MSSQTYVIECESVIVDGKIATRITNTRQIVLDKMRQLFPELPVNDFNYSGVKTSISRTILENNISKLVPNTEDICIWGDIDSKKINTLLNNFTDF